MALLLRNGAVFLHIPKTGGNWVRGVLEKLDFIEGEIGHKHLDVDRVLFEPYFTHIERRISKRADKKRKLKFKHFPVETIRCERAKGLVACTNGIKKGVNDSHITLLYV